MDQTILVVDDDQMIRNTLRDVLSLEGYRVVTAVDGRDAVELMARCDPKLILLDLMMPVMDGWQFRFEQQLDAALRKIPVVVLTAGRPVAHDPAFAGVVCLRKPFHIDELLAAVESALRAV